MEESVWRLFWGAELLEKKTMNIISSYLPQKVVFCEDRALFWKDCTIEQIWLVLHEK